MLHHPSPHFKIPSTPSCYITPHFKMPSTPSCYNTPPSFQNALHSMLHPLISKCPPLHHTTPPHFKMPPLHHTTPPSHFKIPPLHKNTPHPLFQNAPPSHYTTTTTKRDTHTHNKNHVLLNCMTQCWQVLKKSCCSGVALLWCVLITFFCLCVDVNLFVLLKKKCYIFYRCYPCSSK